MPYSSTNELPSSVKNVLPSGDGRRMFMNVVNSQLESGKSEARAFASAWAALENAGYRKGEDGNWTKVEKEPSVSDVHVPSAEWEKPRRRRKAESYKLPESARNNARRVLRWREEHGDEVKGMTEVGWRRARQLANNESVGPETVKAMASFNRHRSHKEVSEEYKGEPWKDAGHVAWLGWGGTTGIDWARGISENLTKRQIDDDIFTMREEAVARSVDLGMGGEIHVHQTADGQSVYMPGRDHEAYLRNMEEMADIDQEYEESGEMSGLARLFAAMFEALGIQKGQKMPQKQQKDSTVESSVVKFDEEQRVVWGWASVISEDGEAIFDTQGDSISPEVMTKAANEFMLDVRMAKTMHDGDQVGEVIHSLPLTKELGQALGIQSSREGWIIAMKIHDDEVWSKVKSGELGAFSIGGEAIRDAVE